MRSLRSLLVIPLIITANANAIGLGPFDVSLTFCRKVQSLGPLLSSYQITQWPVAGLPGIVTGISQRSSVILDLCNIIIQVGQLDTADAIFFAAGKLNDVTKSGFDKQLAFANKTWNMANSVYDFDNGKNRPGVLTSMRAMADLADYYEDASDFAQGRPADMSEHKLRRNFEMLQFAQTAYKRTILQQAINCPTPNPSNPDYTKVYNNEILPTTRRVQQKTYEVNFFSTKLRQIGGRMMAPRFLGKYNDDLQNAIDNGAVFSVFYTQVQEADWQYDGKQVDSDMNGKAKKVTQSRDVQNFTVRQNGQPYLDFQANYENYWGDFAQTEWAKVSSNSLVGVKSVGTTAVTGGGYASGNRDLSATKITAYPLEVVEAEFRDIASECPSWRVDQGLNTSDPDFQNKHNRAMETCQNAIKVNQQNASSLFGYYVNQLQTSSFQYKQALGKLWTLQSKYEGTSHYIDPKKPGKDVVETTLHCQEKLNPVEAQIVGVKQQALQAQMEEKIALQTLKQQKDDDERKKRELEEKRKQEAAVEWAKTKGRDSMTAAENLDAPSLIGKRLGDTGRSVKDENGNSHSDWLNSKNSEIKANDDYNACTSSGKTEAFCTCKKSGKSESECSKADDDAKK